MNTMNNQYINMQKYTRGSATVERVSILHHCIVGCKRHFDMMNHSKACASTIVNDEISLNIK